MACSYAANFLLLNYVYFHSLDFKYIVLKTPTLNKKETSQVEQVPVAVCRCWVVGHVWVVEVGCYTGSCMWMLGCGAGMGG